ncbi:putative reverse transcriptase domain-containing protein [Tanacetum coccineum]|uniref:Reverse transcriptase domain-containing protein n=1 Tax=Tanacetum coccineum TaxID=301880 RepID=A0ABQ4WN51_9ASTR
MSTTYHPQMDGQSERTIKMLEDMLRACVIDSGESWNIHLPLAEFSYNNSYHSSIRCAPFKALYGRKYRLPILWAEIGDSGLIGSELVQETTDKVDVIKDMLKAAEDRLEEAMINRRKPLEFQVGDHVMLKVSPWKGVVRFGKKGKLAPRFVGPFEILKRIVLAFGALLLHVSYLKMCLADAKFHVALDVIKDEISKGGDTMTKCVFSRFSEVSEKSRFMYDLWASELALSNLLHTVASNGAALMLMW